MDRHNAVEVVGTVHGRCFCVRVPAGMADAVRSRLPAGWREGDAGECRWQLAFHPGAGWQVLRDGAPLAAGEAPQAALERLVADVEDWVAAGAVDRVLLRGAAVSWRGGAVVLVGRRGWGTRTLTAQLVARGAGRLATRLVALDHDGLVVDDGGRRRPLRLLARVRYVPAGRWQVEGLSPGRAALALIDAAVADPVRPAEVATAALGAVRGAVALHGTRGEATDAAGRILGALPAGGAPAEPVRTVDLRDRTAHPSGRSTPPGS